MATAAQPVTGKLERAPQNGTPTVTPLPHGFERLERAVHHALEELAPYYHDLLIRLVKIPSEIGEEAAAQDVMQQEMARLGLEVDRFEIDAQALADHPGFNPATWNSPVSRPNVVGRWSGKGGGKSLILNAHMDTVPVGRSQNWELDPFSGLHMDGKIHGRGAWDDKAGCIQMLWITDALQRAGIDLKGDLLLQSVVEDETTANGTLACVHRGHVADGAVILDGTSSDGIIVAHMGQQMFEVTIAGRPAPSVVSFRGHNPISTACRLVERLEAHARNKNAERNAAWGAAAQPNFITITGIQAGDGPSVVPSRCTVIGHFGFCPPQTVEEARAELKAILLEVSQGDEFLEESPLEICFKGYSCEPQSFLENNPVLEQLTRVVERLDGQAPRHLHITGAGDLRHFAQGSAQYIPSCMYGPGRGRGAHVDNEYVETEDLLRVAKSVSSFVLEWCQAADLSK